MSNRLQMWNGTEWQIKANLPNERYTAASIAVDGRMWIIGGYVNWQPTASVLVYDPQTDTWAEGPPLPAPDTRCRAVEHDGAIVVLGNGAPLRLRNGEWAVTPELLGTAHVDDGVSVGSVPMG